MQNYKTLILALLLLLSYSTYGQQTRMYNKQEEKTFKKAIKIAIKTYKKSGNDAALEYLSNYNIQQNRLTKAYLRFPILYLKTIGCFQKNGCSCITGTKEQFTQKLDSLKSISGSAGISVKYKKKYAETFQIERNGKISKQVDSIKDVIKNNCKVPCPPLCDTINFDSLIYIRVKTLGDFMNSDSLRKQFDKVLFNELDTMLFYLEGPNLVCMFSGRSDTSTQVMYASGKFYSEEYGKRLADFYQEISYSIIHYREPYNYRIYIQCFITGEANALPLSKKKPLIYNNEFGTVEDLKTKSIIDSANYKTRKHVTDYYTPEYSRTFTDNYILACLRALHAEWELGQNPTLKKYTDEYTREFGSKLKGIVLSAKDWLQIDPTKTTAEYRRNKVKVIIYNFIPKELVNPEQLKRLIASGKFKKVVITGEKAQ